MKVVSKRKQAQTASRRKMEGREIAHEAVTGARVTRRIRHHLWCLRRARVSSVQRVALRPLTHGQFRGLAEMMAVAIESRSRANAAIPRRWIWAVEATLQPMLAPMTLGQGRKLLEVPRRGGGLLVRADEEGRVYLQQLETAGDGFRPVRGAQSSIEPAELPLVAEVLGKLVAERAEKGGARDA